MVPPHALGRERAAQGLTPGATRYLGGVRGKGAVDRETEDEFVEVVDGQTVDVALRDSAGGMVAVRFRPGLILTPQLAAVISRAYHDSKNSNFVRPRNEGDQPPDAYAS